VLEGEVEVSLTRALQTLFRRAPLQCPVQIGSEFAVRLTHHIRQYVLTALEVSIERGGRHTDRLRQLPHREAVDSFGEVEVAGVGQDVVALVCHGEHCKPSAFSSTDALISLRNGV
jgi:hypothetical protein